VRFVSAIRSKPALIVGSILVVVFFTITKGWAVALRSDGNEMLLALFRFFHPATSKEPGRWLTMEGVVLLTGFAGATMVSAAFSGRGLGHIGDTWSAIRAGGWRPMLWALLIGSHGWNVLGLFLAFGGGPGRDHGIMSQILSLLWYVAPVGSVYCAARLLFGRGAWRIDPWLGYITAAAASFGIAWTGILLSGLGDSVPFAGAFGAGNMASGITHVSTLALGCIATWTGRVLARQRESAMLGLRPLTPAVPLLTSGAVLGVALAKLYLLGFRTQSLSAGQIASYVALLGLFAAAMALNLAHTAAQIAPAAATGSVPAALPRTGLLRRAGAALAAGRFWRDFFLSLAITIVLLGMAYMTVGQTPLLAAAFIMPLIILGFLIGPIVMFVIGVLRGRPGFAAAPVLLLVAAFGYRYANQVEAAQQAASAVNKAAALNVYPFAAPSRQHDLVVIEGDYDSRADGHCQDVCQQILLSGRYAVAYAEPESGQWRRYRLAHGTDFCRQPAQVESYLQMIAWRRLDTCLAITREAPGQNALIIRDGYALDLAVEQQLPKGLQGSVMEFHERIDGRDRLLGRVVTGFVQAPLLSNKPSTETALQLSGAAFYAAALSLPLTDQLSRGDGDPAALVAAYESLFDDPTVGNQARDYFRGFGGKTEAEVAPKRAAILRFWQSNDPRLIKLGLASLSAIKSRGLEFAKPFVTQYLASNDPVVMQAAVSALHAFDKDLEFAKPALADLILSDRIAGYADDFDSLIGILRILPGGFAPDARSRAKTQLDSRPDLADGRLLAVLAILARGDARTRQEAVDWILAQQGDDLERAVAAVALKYDALTAGSSARFWTKQEIEQLIARGPSVSNDGLIPYVRALQHQVEGRELRPMLRDLLERRAAALDDGSAADQKLAKKMRNAARGIRD
jgi:hypothetical protein